jgi:hypothetical protein
MAGLEQACERSGHLQSYFLGPADCPIAKSAMSLAVEWEISGQIAGKSSTPLAGSHHLAATRRDAAIHQKPIEGDALITQRVALVDADDRRRQALDILAFGEAGPRQRVVGVEGLV